MSRWAATIRRFHFTMSCLRAQPPHSTARGLQAGLLRIGPGRGLWRTQISQLSEFLSSAGATGAFGRVGVARWRAGCCCGEGLLDEGCLAVAVGVPVGAEPRGEGSFQLRVGAGLAGVRAQVVAESEMSGQFRASGRGDVEVVSGRGGRAGEGFPAGDAEVCFVAVAEGGELADGCRQVGAGGDDDVDVDDGLGGQARDCGAADMLDLLGKRAEHACDLVAERGEDPGPARVVASYLDWCVQLGCPFLAGAAPADLGCVSGPVAGGGALPGDGDADVDAEHAGEDGGGQVGGELEQCGRARLAGVDADLAQAFGELEGADRLAGLAAGEQPGRGALVADGSVAVAGRDELQYQGVQWCGEQYGFAAQPYAHFA